jgi:hypothetical protein
MSRKSFLALAAGVALLIVGFVQACKDKDPICYQGNELIDGKCQCPPGKRVINRVCRALYENEYYGYTANCSCNDTIYFYIHSIDTATNGSKIAIVEYLTNNGDYIGYPFEYFEKVDGDSLVGTGPGCAGESWQIACKLLPGDSMRMDAKYRHWTSLASFYWTSCTVYLRKD